jgi:hypothetical protein
MRRTRRSTRAADPADSEFQGSWPPPGYRGRYYLEDKFVARPAEKTIKRLFAVSGNLCAFPKCKSSLVHEDSGKVTGRICHIKGNRPGAKRYDSTQSDEDRHGFDNLILLCPTHHDVVDDDEIAYTVDRLSQMKTTHEAKSRDSKASELPSNAVDQLLLTIQDNQITDGSIIVTHNQIGGKNAHKIINIGPQPRNIAEPARLAIASCLQVLPAHDYEIQTNYNDADGSNLAYQITEILNTARWNCIGSASCMFPRPMIGITISYPTKTAAVAMLISQLGSLGFPIAEDHLPELRFVSILVGYRENGA